ncbi:hypothetical protein Sango_0148600 [Sesamum angolense]|uniref:Uncharacterized protein n=1 Tax=Sesamum angolense TaxID=2727404 RepID=A0AAE1XF44_9LAMI|nr:hypothetical protein Sango_0148600 [Sesamum angolense]
MGECEENREKEEGSRKEEENEGIEEQDEGNVEEVEEEQEGENGQDEGKKTEGKIVKNGSKKETRNEIGRLPPRTPAIERPRREKKKVEVITVGETARRSTNKPFAIEKGQGMQLKDIPNVAFKLSKRKADENLQLLHTILFGKKAKVHTLKKNIGLFSGFVWIENEKHILQKRILFLQNSFIIACNLIQFSFMKFESGVKLLATPEMQNQDKKRAKLKEKIDKCVKEKLLDFCDVLDISVNKATIKKEELSVKLLEFLESPHAKTETLLAEKEKQLEGKKRKRSNGSASKSPSSSNVILRKSTKIRVVLHCLPVSTVLPSGPAAWVPMDIELPTPIAGTMLLATVKGSPSQNYSRLTEPNVVKTIGSIISGYFLGAWISYNQVPVEVRDFWFLSFQKFYAWDVSDTVEMRKMFDNKARTWMRQTLYRARRKGQKMSWISNEYWSQMLSKWANKCFPTSQKNEANQSNIPSAWVACKNGSALTSQDKHQMEELRMLSTRLEQLKRAWRKDGIWNGPLAEEILEAYHGLLEEWTNQDPSSAESVASANDNDSDIQPKANDGDNNNRVVESGSKHKTLTPCALALTTYQHSQAEATDRRLGSLEERMEDCFRMLEKVVSFCRHQFGADCIPLDILAPSAKLPLPGPSPPVDAADKDDSDRTVENTDHK